MKDYVKEEASVAISTRIDVRKIVECLMYFESEGYKPRTMSQLVSWSVEGLATIVKMHKNIENIESIKEAIELLEDRGLMQRQMSGRGRGLRTQIVKGFENLRLEGVEPEEYASQAFKVVHGNSKNRQDNELPEDSMILNEKTKEAVEIYKKLDDKTNTNIVNKDELERVKEYLKASGLLVKE